MIMKGNTTPITRKRFRLEHPHVNHSVIARAGDDRGADILVLVDG